MSDSHIMRMTQSRKAILSALSASELHPTADDVYSIVRGKLPKISLWTVYRKLDLLAKHGFIRALATAGEPRRYDGMLEEHHHIRCDVCGRIDDVTLGHTEPFEELVVDGAGYEVHGYTLCFTGVCRECNGNGQDGGENGKGSE
jgi:Fur family ferric uptake transcriptional regulator